ncbi:hypothetical protein [Dyadobacter fanqingshengii]|uniref:Uncharacterized protein n=1 Tax=Dyadobacter fanqingshengii TaxID=2906443 RepID=A0A9X1TBH3_9BACT|nr:hypothetical protein [Dyadobacter fanqingshengii]MCF0043655.1 hypothetical protein [Dyadobacter fanqingshengii]USJ34729.1 hypothetical protein NFI81_18700 [Dyadobacter fanqingshengii]
MSLIKAIPPKQFNGFLKDELSEFPALTDEKIHQVSQAFYFKFGPSDYLSSPFQKNIFLDAGAYLKSYKRETLERGKEAVHHFEFYLLDQPEKTGAFSLSDLKDAEITSSRSKFVALVDEEVAKVERE